MLQWPGASGGTQLAMAGAIILAAAAMRKRLARRQPPFQAPPVSGIFGFTFATALPKM